MFSRSFILILIIVILVTPLYATPNLNGPSGLITMPTAYLRSGIATHTTGGDRFYKYNQIILSGLAEVGVVQNRSRNKESYNGKLSIMSDNGILPAISIGMTDISDDYRDSSKYLVLSKNFGMMGLTLHGGYYKSGKVNSTLGLTNYNFPYKKFSDLSKENGYAFFGIEYSFIPLFSLMGERVDDMTNVGVRFSPLLPGLTIDWDFLDIKNNNNLKDRKIVNVRYKFGF